MGTLFVEASAKRGEGVTGAFDELVNRVSGPCSAQILIVWVALTFADTVATFNRSSALRRFGKRQRLE